MSRSLSWLAKNVMLDLIERASRTQISELRRVAAHVGTRFFQCTGVALAFWIIVLAGVALEAWRPIALRYLGFPSLGLTNDQVVWSAPVTHEALCRWINSTNVGDGHVACQDVGGSTRLVVRDSGGVLVVGKDGSLALGEVISSDEYTLGSRLQIRQILNFEDQRRMLFDYSPSDGEMKRVEALKWSKAAIDSSQVVLAAKELAGLAPMSDASLPWLGEQSHIASADSVAWFMALLLGNAVSGWFCLLAHLSMLALFFVSVWYVGGVIKGATKQKVVLAAKNAQQGLLKLWQVVRRPMSLVAVFGGSLLMLCVIIGSIYPWVSSGREWYSNRYAKPAWAKVDSCELWSPQESQEDFSSASSLGNSVCRREGETYMMVAPKSVMSMAAFFDGAAKRGGMVKTKDGMVLLSARGDLMWSDVSEPAWSLRSWQEYWGFAPLSEASRAWALGMRRDVGERANGSLGEWAAHKGGVIKTWSWEGLKALPVVFFIWIVLPGMGLGICAWLVKIAATGVSVVGRRAMASAPVGEFVSRAEARELDRVARKSTKKDGSARGRL